MATHFSNISGNPEITSEDNCNFYHSQLPVRIECAFCMLVQKWGILRTPMPYNITIKRVIVVVNAVARLHNLCISKSHIPAEALARDVNNVINKVNGFVEMTTGNETHTAIPTDLMDVGHHFICLPCSN